MKKRSQQGFTLIELLIVIPIVLFSVGYTMSFMIDLYASSLAKTQKLNLQTDSQMIAATVQNDTFYATGILTAVPSPLTFVDPSPPTGGWSISSLTTGVNNALVAGVSLSYPKALLITTEYQTTSKASGRNLIPNTAIGATTPYLRNVIIYYVKESGIDKRQLYRRVIPENGTPPVGIASSRTATCTQISISCTGGQQADTLLAENLDSASATFYTPNDSVASIVTGGSFNAFVSKVKLQLTLKQLVAGTYVTSDSSTVVKITNCSLASQVSCT